MNAPLGFRCPDRHAPLNAIAADLTTSALLTACPDHPRSRCVAATVIADPDTLPPAGQEWNDHLRKFLPVTTTKHAAARNMQTAREG
jgi:hypothetical protein